MSIPVFDSRLLFGCCIYTVIMVATDYHAREYAQTKIISYRFFFNFAADNFVVFSDLSVVDNPEII